MHWCIQISKMVYNYFFQTIKHFIVPYALLLFETTYKNITKMRELIKNERKHEINFIQQNKQR